MQWSDHFPTNCPPKDAKPASGDVFRLVKKNLITNKDFITLAQRKSDEDYGKDQCKACGVSVYRDINDARKMRKRVRPMRKKKIAKGTLRPNLGYILDTPSFHEKTHITWWVPVGVKPQSIFSVVSP